MLLMAEGLKRSKWARPVDPTSRKAGSSRLAVLGAVVLLAGVISGTPINVVEQAQAASPYSKGEMVAFVIHKKPRAVADVKFVDETETQRTLKDWKGRVVLVNLWATWCAPCKKEMPSLNTLQQELGGEDFEVVAISVDRKGLKASSAFLKETGADALALYNDKSARASIDLKAFGLPATILIGRKGQELGRLVGPAEWASEDAKALIQAAIDGKISSQKGS